MNINETYRLVNLIAKKNQRGYISATEFNEAVRTAELYVFNERYKQYAKSKKIHEDLLPFMKEEVLTPSVIGTILFPQDYQYLLEAIAVNPKGASDNCEERPKGVYQGSPFKIIEKGKIGYRLGSSFLYPDYRYPMLEIKDSFFEVYPHDIGTVQISYLRLPIASRWAYTIQAGKQIYDATNSIDLEWGDTVHTEIVMQTLIYLGINLRDTELVQYANELKIQEAI